jgi:hypothetical protein
MNYSRGQNVIVKDFRGRRYPRKVWADKGERVEITSAEVFRLLERGETELWPIAVPKCDVSAVRPRR